MKSLEEFNQFIDQQLSNELKTVEQQRIAGRNWMRRMWAFSILFFVLFVLFIIWFAASSGDARTTSGTNSTQIILMVGVVILFSIGGYAMSYFMKKQKGSDAAADFQQDFKHRVVKPIIGFIDPGLTYQPLNHASYDEFTESGLFIKKDYHITGNDQVYGKKGDMNFQFCDLLVTHTPLITMRGQGPDTVFCGSYFIGQFPRYFSAPVYILSRSGRLESWFAGSAADEGFIQTWNLGKKVLPADASFNKQFMVYSPLPEDAEQLLTPSLMERIREISGRTNAKLWLSFYNNRVYAAIDHGMDYFETTLNRSLENRKMLESFYLDFMSVLQLADDLKSNATIWTTNAFSRS
jgi:hypothetical protein